MRNLFAAAFFTGPGAFALLFEGIFSTRMQRRWPIASQMSVPFSTLMSVWLLGETIRWRRRLGIVLAFARHRNYRLRSARFSVLGRTGAGGLLVLVSSLGLIYLKRLKGIRPLELQAWIAVLGGRRPAAVSLGIESGQWMQSGTQPGAGGARLLSPLYCRVSSRTRLVLPDQPLSGDELVAAYIALPAVRGVLRRDAASRSTHLANARRRRSHARGRSYRAIARASSRGYGNVRTASSAGRRTCMQACRKPFPIDFIPNQRS